MVVRGLNGLGWQLRPWRGREDVGSVRERDVVADGGRRREDVAPNNYRYLQVRRAGMGAGSGTVGFTQTSYARVDVTGAGEGTVPSPRHGLRCHPNPFNPRTTLSFELPTAGPTLLSVFDPAGRLVRVLMDEQLSAGPHSVIWDGCDRSGREVGSGVYLARLEFGEESGYLKIQLVR